MIYKIKIFAPSYRRLDSVEVRVDNERKVWVKGQSFQPGIGDKKAIV